MKLKPNSKPIVSTDELYVNTKQGLVKVEDVKKYTLQTLNKHKTPTFKILKDS